jgi:hypothetical protein
MFCPNCKAEYRNGVSKCSDCQVALVADLPEDESPQAFDVLWRGEDPILHDTLCGELEAAGIEYAAPPLEVFLRQFADPLNFSINPKFGFVVGVRGEDLARARVILEKLLDREPVHVSLAPAGDGVGATTPVDESPLPLYWDPVTATVEVWTGHNRDKSQFLAKSLEEVGIPSRTLGGEREILRLLVRRVNEEAAREVIRQVLEASTPDTSSPRPVEDAWYDEPVRSYLFAWLPGVVFMSIFFLADVSWSPFSRPVDSFLSFLSSINYIAFLWMVYQAIRYEIHPLQFILLACFPFSSVWYYLERYSRRQGPRRLPLAVRERMSPPH